MRRIFVLFALVIPLLLLIGCPEQTQPKSTVSISPAKATVFINETRSFVATISTLNSSAIEH